MPVGFTIEIIVEDADRKLSALRETLRSPIPAHKEIGKYIQDKIPEHIDAAVDEKGNPWKPLAPATIAIKKALGYTLQPLVRKGRLRGEISYWYSASEIGVGSALDYSPRQQLGDNVIMGALGIFKNNIPARPFLYITETEGDTVIEIYKKHIARAIEQGPVIGGWQ